MKTKVMTILCGVCVLCGLTLLTSCKATGNLGQDAQSYWNSPTTQALLQEIQDEAFAWLRGRIHLAGASQSSESLTEQAVRAGMAKHPNVPENVIRAQVNKAYDRAQAAR